MVTTDDIIKVMKDAGIARGKCESLDPDKPLADQGLDSYDRMSLLFEVEQNFNVELPTDIAKDLKTLNDVVNHLNRKD
jgi:acyl carrier protein